MSQYDHLWIDTNQLLAVCCAELQSSNAIAVDTEFMRSTTFYPKAALIQIYDGQQTYLIDPLAITDFTPLVEILTNTAIVKIFHSCSEDLEVFQCFLHCVPQPIVDTQIAAALLNYGSAMGYANLVNALLSIELEKGETRSDWLQRPLQKKQIDYAIQDVHYLLQVYHGLLEQLQEKNRFNWLVEECSALVKNAEAETIVEDYYLKIKSAWKLNSEQLLVLKELSTWRENLARELDLPRNHIVPEKALLDIARQQIEDIDGLVKVEDLHRRKRQKYGKQIINVVQSINDSLDVPPALPKPLVQVQRDLMKKLKAKVEDVAEKCLLPTDILAKKNDLELLVRSEEAGQFSLPQRLSGWRKDLVGDSLLAIATKSAK